MTSNELYKHNFFESLYVICVLHYSHGILESFFSLYGRKEQSFLSTSYNNAKPKIGFACSNFPRSLTNDGFFPPTQFLVFLFLLKKNKILSNGNWGYAHYSFNFWKVYHQLAKKINIRFLLNKFGIISKCTIAHVFRYTTKDIKTASRYV